MPYMTKTRSLIEARELKGVWPALMTLMDRYGRVDRRNQAMHIENLMDSGIDGLVVMGTTGQAACFNHDEHVKEVLWTAKMVNGQVPIIVGAGSNSTWEAVALAERIEDELGPTTFLETTGYYLKPSIEAAVNHYISVARSILGNIVLYNVPGRVITRLTPESILYMQLRDNIIGLKQADSSDKDFGLVRKVLEKTDRNRFNIVSGEDNLVYGMMELGATGVISATANACPKLFVNLVRSFQQGDKESARRYQEEVMPFVNFAFQSPGNNPSNLAYLFHSQVRGCNYNLPGCLEIAEGIHKMFPGEETASRVKGYKDLMDQRRKLIDIPNDNIGSYLAEHERRVFEAEDP